MKVFWGYCTLISYLISQRAIPALSGLYIVCKPPGRMYRGWEFPLHPSEPKRHLGVEDKLNHGAASRKRQSSDYFDIRAFYKNPAGLSSNPPGGVTLRSPCI